MTKSAMSKVKPLKFKKLYLIDCDEDEKGWYAVISNKKRPYGGDSYEHTQKSFVASTASKYKTKDEAVDVAKSIAASFGAELVDMRGK